MIMSGYLKGQIIDKINIIKIQSAAEIPST